MSLFKIYDIPVGRLLNLDYCNSILESEKDMELRMLPTINILTESAYQYFKSYDLNKTFMVFYQKSKKVKPTVHVDYLSYGHLANSDYHPYSLNVIIKGQGAMQWFHPEGSGVLNTHPVGVRYRLWPLFQKGPVIDSWNEGKVALVRTDVPHTTVNDDLEDRVSVSIRWKNMLMPWDELITKFDNELKLFI